jgi:hypothetical protein
MNFLRKKKCRQNNFEHIQVDSVVNADPKYVVSLESSPIRSTTESYVFFFSQT